MPIWKKINETLDNEEFWAKPTMGCWVATGPLPSPLPVLGLSSEFQVQQLYHLNFILLEVKKKIEILPTFVVSILIRVKVQ